MYILEDKINSKYVSYINIDTKVSITFKSLKFFGEHGFSDDKVAKLIFNCLFYLEDYWYCFHNADLNKYIINDIYKISSIINSNKDFDMKDSIENLLFFTLQDFPYQTKTKIKLNYDIIGFTIPVIISKYKLKV